MKLYEWLCSALWRSKYNVNTVSYHRPQSWRPFPSRRWPDRRQAERLKGQVGCYTAHTVCTWAWTRLLDVSVVSLLVFYVWIISQDLYSFILAQLFRLYQRHQTVWVNVMASLPHKESPLADSEMHSCACRCTQCVWLTVLVIFLYNSHFDSFCFLFSFFHTFSSSLMALFFKSKWINQ